MSTHRAIDRICAAAVILSVLAALLFINGEAIGIQPAAKVMGYESRLFDTSRVHIVEIVMDDWDSFLESCEDEEYAACSVVIDNDSYKNVGLRAKGNTSLSSVSQLGSNRYSFKLEFDCYEADKSYYGLDKLCLNNIIQDNTYMKDYLTYRMMADFGVTAPLCSFVYITVNGEDWGLYLAVEGVEEAFLQRNYGGGYGRLYKPDSMSFGGGRGNGRDFDMNDFAGQFDAAGGPPTAEQEQSTDGGPPQMPGGVGSASDVKLQYIDDDPDSYTNIFNNAKTDASDADQARLISSLKSLSDFRNLEDVLDTEKVLRYFVVHNFVVNGDSYTGNMIHNYYLYEKDGRLAMIPWDYNLAYGTFQGQDAAGAVNDPIDDVLSDRPMQAWIFSDESYTQRYHELYSDFLSTADPAQIIEDAYALISGYVEKDPTKFCTCEEFETGVQALKAFCSLRRESVQGQLAGTIPSTSEGQNADSSVLINADDLSLSDMGTMNNGGGGPSAPGGFGGNGNPDGQVQPEGNAQPPDSGGAPPEKRPDVTEAEPGRSTENGQPPEGGRDNFLPPGFQETSDSGQAAVIALSVSILVLAAGLIFAFRFRR